MKYRTIVADPPWHYEGGGTGYQKESGIERFLPYESMDLQSIAALPVATLAAPAAHVYLWTTNRYIWDARGVAESWGVQISQVLTWCKAPMGLGPGGAFANTTEFILFGRMRLGPIITAARESAGLTKRDIATYFPSKTGGLTGCVTNWELDFNIPTPGQWDTLRAVIPGLANLPDVTPEPCRHHSTWFLWKRGAHSQKPEAFIDLVEQVSPPPYVELFARRHRLGWDVWGNESANTATLTPDRPSSVPLPPAPVAGRRMGH